jgi:hypothetical protein
MRTPAMILIAAIAGVVLGWLLLTQLPQQPFAPAQPASTVPKSADSTPAATAAARPSAPDANPAPPTAPQPSVAVEKSEATGTTDDSTKPAEPAKVDSPAGDKSTEPASDETGEADPSQDGDSPPSGVDVDRAADLLADWMAKQDAVADEGGESPQTEQVLRTFDQEEADPAWSGPTAQQIEATLDAWIAALPDDVRDHIAIIHVECRLTLCQILAADDDLAAQNQRAQSSQEWQQAVATLPQQPWWQEFGFVDLMNAIDSDEASGYVLYQSYLRREVKPSG